jgi:hypothetical protein
LVEVLGDCGEILMKPRWDDTPAPRTCGAVIDECPAF